MEGAAAVIGGEEAAAERATLRRELLLGHLLALSTQVRNPITLNWRP